MDFSSMNPGTVIGIVVLLALAPFIAVMVTSYTKIVVVLSLLRNALGLQQAPPNMVLNGLAVILSIYVMYPIGMEIKEKADAKWFNNEQKAQQLSLEEVLATLKSPLTGFLYEHSEKAERQFFLKSVQRLAKKKQALEFSEKDFVVLVPAFVVGELTEAFQIGFLIFLPFLVVDLIVSNILLALGMMMLAPTTVSLPFKLLLLVFVSGWTHIIHGLVATYF